ncbi:hemopexin repeat-containing protein [Thalassotalea sp. PLHSN55]
MIKKANHNGLLFFCQGDNYWRYDLTLLN